MSKIDGGLWGEIKKDVQFDFVERQENRLTNGTPDVYLINSIWGSHWIELKHIPKLTPGKLAGLRPEQKNWHHDANKVSPGISSIALKVGGDFYAIWHGVEARNLFEKPVAEMLKFARYTGDRAGFMAIIQQLAK